MSQSLVLSQGLRLTLTLEQNRARRTYAREALKAFRKFIVGSRTFYTCNVARLKSCNRLGTEKELTLWQTHFFMCSHHFDDVEGVIFNVRPGNELASFTRMAQIDSLCLALGPTEMVNTGNGVRTTLEQPLVFASDEAPSPHAQPRA